ncbi:MAG: 3-phosphoshikimate 1-carboxyvinyltransferase, partial [Abditibacteriota bacterium]|nr:3-phosphoshikimate 1-carboxyvinyltransferase [Abditibacteriota bacterium]
DKGPRSLTVRGSLGPGTYRIRGDLSSQFASGLLFVLPLMDGDSRIEFTTPPESLPYIQMTIQVLDMFGVKVNSDGDALAIPGGQKYLPRDADAEGDWSNAAFLEVLNLFGGSVKTEGLDPDSLQGDKICREYFARLAAGFAEADISQCPDLGPVLFAAAAGLHGGRFTGTARLAIKESDRAAAMAEELAKFGIRCRAEDNEFTVYPGELKAPTVPLYGHNDHRIVMALASLLTVTGGSLRGAEAVNKSWPEYFDTLKTLGVEVYAVD